ncbi:MAG: hypothetical protein IJ109_00130 [Firmicutes bacterium]|nr:hypothetical protein [Bacillota bacterium]
MKKQYTSMQQELAARKAAGGYDTASGGRSADSRRSLRDAVKPAGRRTGKRADRRSGKRAAAKSAGPDAVAKSAGPVAAADPAPLREGRNPKTLRGSSVFLLLGALIFLSFLLPALVISSDDDWDSDADWSAASDYGIDETSGDADVLEFIQDYTYAPDEDDVDTDALQQWLETSPDLLADVPGSWEITSQENRVIIRAAFDPDTEDSGEVLSYWEDAYSTIYDSLLDAGLEDLSVAVILRDSVAQDLYGIQIDGSTYYSAESF